MKKNVKLLLACAVLLFLVTTAIAVGVWIYSLPVTVTVSEYVVSLTIDNVAPIKNENITLQGLLTKNSVAVPDATIHILQNDTEIATTITNSTGGYSYIWNATEVGTFNFKVGYQTP